MSYWSELSPLAIYMLKGDREMKPLFWESSAQLKIKSPVSDANNILVLPAEFAS